MQADAAIEDDAIEDGRCLVDQFVVRRVAPGMRRIGLRRDFPAHARGVVADARLIDIFVAGRQVAIKSRAPLLAPAQEMDRGEDEGVGRIMVRHLLYGIERLGRGGRQGEEARRQKRYVHRHAEDLVEQRPQNLDEHVAVARGRWSVEAWVDGVRRPNEGRRLGRAHQGLGFEEGVVDDRQGQALPSQAAQGDAGMGIGAKLL